MKLEDVPGAVERVWFLAPDEHKANVEEIATTRRDMFPRELGRLRQHACKLTEGM